MKREIKLKNKISLFSVLALSLTINPYLWANEPGSGCKKLFQHSKAENITFFKNGDFFSKPKDPVETPLSKEEQEQIRQYEQARDDFLSLENPAVESAIKPNQTSPKLYPTKYGMLTRRGLLHAKGLDAWEWPTDF